MDYRNVTKYVSGSVSALSAIGASVSIQTDNYYLIAPVVFTGVISSLIYLVNERSISMNKNLETKIDNNTKWEQKK